MPAGPKERLIEVKTPLETFPIRFYFNCFSVDREENITFISFGCVFKGRLLDDVFSCAVGKETLEVARDSIIQYLGKTGEIAPMTQDVTVRPNMRIIPIGIIGMAFRGDVAETILHDFSAKATAIEPTPAKLNADPVALLRSPLNVQRHLIRALYSVT